MKKKCFLSLLLLLPLVANSAAVKISGIWYNLNSNSKTAEVTSQNGGSNPTLASNSNYYTGAVTIPSTVTSNSVTYNVTTIGKWAFSNCTGLTSVSIPSSILSIGEGAFMSCTGITSLSIPNSVTNIDGAFNGCENLETINIPNQVTSIGASTFNLCRKLNSIVIPNGVTSIGQRAFSNCNSLSEINIPDGVTEILQDAFFGCTSLTSINIPKSVKYLNRKDVDMTGNVFAGCSNLISIIVDPDNTVFDSRNNCNAIIWTSQNYLLTGCKKTTIPYSVVSIGEDSFYHNTGLTSITIPRSVTGIVYGAFSGCSNLTSVYMKPQTPPTLYGDPLPFSYCGNPKLYVPTGRLSAYQSASNYSSSFNEIVEIEYNISFADAKVKNICVNNWDEDEDNELSFDEAAGVTDLATLFQGNTTITSFNELENFINLESIGSFNGCSNLSSITIPNSVTTISKNTFNGTAWYNNKPNGLVYAGNVAYKYKGQMPENTSISIQEGTTGIAEEAFNGCTGLSSVSLPNTIISIQDKAFYGCSSLTSVSVDMISPISISSMTFSNSSNATLIVPAASKADYEAANYWKDFKEINSSVSYTLSSVGMGTYCSPYDLDFTNVSGIRAYIACGFNPTTGTVFIMRVNEVPANTGILIKGTPGTYSVPLKNTNMYYSNMFKGTLTAITVPATEDGMKNYVLLGSDLLFHGSLGGSTLTANRAYLQIPLSVVGNPANTRGFVTLEENGTTGIVYSETMEERDNGKIYNLNGQQITSPKKGLYIRNGKKVLIH